MPAVRKKQKKQNSPVAGIRLQLLIQGEGDVIQQNKQWTTTRTFT